MPPVSAEFLAFIGPLIEPNKPREWYLPNSFLTELFQLCSQAPISSTTRNREVMFSIFTTNHLNLALNALCSARLAGVPDSGYIFIALDRSAYARMKTIKTEVVFYDCESMNLTVRDLARVKLLIHWHILTWRIDSTIADDDIVFVQDPRLLYRADSHAEIGGNVLDGFFSDRFDFTQFNVGFFRVISSRLSVIFWKVLIRMTFDQPNQLTQIVMFETLKRYRNQFNQTPMQTYALRELIGLNGDYIIRFYDPLQVMNCGLLVRNSHLVPGFARLRNISRPHLVHSAYLGPGEKEPMLTTRKLWWISSDGQCAKIPPDGASFIEWTSGPIPTQLPIMPLPSHSQMRFWIPPAAPRQNPIPFPPPQTNPNQNPIPFPPFGGQLKQPITVAQARAMITAQIQYLIALLQRMPSSPQDQSSLVNIGVPLTGVHGQKG
jgi:hypothetical protein